MKTINNILFWTTTVLLILAILVLTIPKIFGVEFRAVLTGSMEPAIPVGSLVVIVPTKADDIVIGDDITFVSESGKAVTHRVIEIDREENTFTTYGIANGISNKDAANRYENIIGVVRFHTPEIGRAFSWFASITGKIISATVIVSVYLITALLSVLFGKKDETKEQVQIPFNDMQNPAFQSKEACPATAMYCGNQTYKTETVKQKKRIRPEDTDAFWTGEDMK